MTQRIGSERQPQLQDGGPSIEEKPDAAPKPAVSRLLDGLNDSGHSSKFWALVSVVSGLVLWEVLGRWVVNPLFLPPLSDIWTRFLELVANGQLGHDVWTSAQEYLLGLLVAILVGSSVGIAMAASSIIRHLLEPWVAVLNATPTIALAPLFIVMLGLGIESKVVVVALVMLFPILINTFAGFSNTDEDLVETARSYCATPRQIYMKVKFPMAVPYLIAGLRLASAHGLVGVVVAEMFGARAGIGLLILNSAETFDSRALFVGIIILAVVGVTLTYSLIWAEKKIAGWRLEEMEK